MAIADRIPISDGITGYEWAALVGILLTLVGSSMSWLNIEATSEAAAEHDDIEPGTNAFTGFDLSWGDLTALLAVIALVVLVLVLWRYRAAGRKTGLVLMLIGMIAGIIGLIGILLTGMLFSGIEHLEGVSLDVGTGIFVTLFGALVLFCAGILRLAAGSPDISADGADG